MKEEIDQKKLYYILEILFQDIKCNDKINKLVTYINNNKLNTDIVFNKIIELTKLQNIKLRIYIYSVFMYIDKSSYFINKILKLTKNSILSTNAKYYLLYQCAAKSFSNKKFLDKNTHTYIRKLYNSIYQDFYTEFVNDLQFIPKQKRDKKLILVFTSQFLDLNHAPTRRVLNRCIDLNLLGYKTILINTAEAVSLVESFPLCKAVAPNYINKFSQYNSIDHEEHSIPYFQCTNNMPNTKEIGMILNMVKKSKPYLVFSFGNFNITSDLINNIVPVANISLESKIPITKSLFHIKGTNITNKDIKTLEKFDFTEKNLLINKFTYYLKEQTKQLNRKNLNIPDNKFIITLIGSRLTEEVDEHFIEALLKTTSNNTHIVFIGIFNKYDTLADKNKLFKNSTTNLGRQNDVLAILECCDLYVNPPRAGGGSSSVEALSKGVPILTLRSGDVYTNAGEEFSVKNTKQLIKKINLYALDKKYYKKMSKKAIKKAKTLTETKKPLKKLIKTIKKNPLFK